MENNNKDVTIYKDRVPMSREGLLHMRYITKRQSELEAKQKSIADENDSNFNDEAE